MSDIIANAKRLLEGATPGPWEWVGYDIEQTTEAGGGMVMDVSCDNPHSGWIEPVEIAPDDEALIAAAPELAQALAEESWEYQVQARSMKRPAWEPSTNGVLQKWYGAEDIEEAKGKARAFTPYFHGREEVEIRVLRRRVSQPEVCE